MKYTEDLISSIDAAYRLVDAEQRGAIRGKVIATRRYAFYVVDVETTGTDPDVDEIVELSAVVLAVDVACFDSGSCLAITASVAGAAVDTLVQPTIPIPPVASAVHHLTDQCVAGSPTVDEAMQRLADHMAQTERLADHMAQTVGELGREVIIAAHNAPFDRSFVARHLVAAGVPSEVAEASWVCTRRLAMHLWPDAPGTSNQVLRYWRGLDINTYPLAPHRALADAIVTRGLLVQLVADMAAKHPDVMHRGIEAIQEFAEAPAELAVMPFGKHRGVAFGAIPGDYLWWMQKQAQIDPDAKHSAVLELKRRGW